MTRVLFVCTGNVHRSVLAERLLAARLPPGSALRPQSAGTQARPWHGMEASTKAVLEELGADGSGFTARPLTTQLVAEAALVLGLAHEHREAAVRLAPTALRRCFTLKEFVRLATGETHTMPGQKGMATTHSGVSSSQTPRVADTLHSVIAATANRRGALPTVPPAQDNIPDPQGLPQTALHECAREIDKAVKILARLLDSAADL